MCFSTDFEMRCPQGKKTKLYKRAKLEKFAHYLLDDGLISRLSVFDDKESKKQRYILSFLINNCIQFSLKDLI